MLTRLSWPSRYAEIAPPSFPLSVFSTNLPRTIFCWVSGSIEPSLIIRFALRGSIRRTVSGTAANPFLAWSSEILNLARLPVSSSPSCSQVRPRVPPVSYVVLQSSSPLPPAFYRGLPGSLTVKNLFSQLIQWHLPFREIAFRSERPRVFRCVDTLELITDESRRIIGHALKVR